MIRIAFLNTNREPYPLPDKIINGGLWVTGKLVEAFSQKRACQVSFFTSEDSVLPQNVTKITLGLDSFYKQVGSRDVLPAEISTAVFLEQALVSEAIKMAKGGYFDLIHVHSNILSVGHFLQFFPIPVIYTLHDPIQPYHQFLKPKGIKNLRLVTVSDYQKKKAKSMGINVFSTVYNGIDLENFHFDPKGTGDLLFCGRIILKKGIEEAIKAAKVTKKRLLVIGHYRQYDQDLRQKKIINQFDNKTIVWRAPQKRLEAVKYYSRAKATLVPILWEEPFGLVPIESLAAGTPVIAYARGALPEIIEDGKTGFLINPSDKDVRGNWTIKKTGLAGLKEAVEKIYSLPKNQYLAIRKECRSEAERKYSLDQMIDNYDTLYRKIVR